MFLQADGSVPLQRDERRGLLDGIGQLWLHGVDIDWVPLHQGRQPRRVPLPSYAFERKRYWLERRLGNGGAPAQAAPEAGQEIEASYDRPDLRTPYAAPGNEIEAKLAEIWQSYLGVENIGTRDNFFELGGDSLVAIRVHAQIKRDLGVELPVGKMFEFATIRRIYLFIIASLDPQAIDTLAEEELEDLLTVMES